MCSIVEYHSGVHSSNAVFFNLFCEAKPFAAILIAQGTHVLGGRGSRGRNLRPKAESREGFGGKGQHKYISDPLRA